MRFTLTDGSGVVGYETNAEGYVTVGRIPAVAPAGLPTTASQYAVGCQITDASNGQVWLNVGSVAVPSWTLEASPLLGRVAQVNLAIADFIATTTGSLSHAQGLIVVPAAPTGYVNQFICGAVSFTAGTTPLTGGGNFSFNIGGGGAALTGIVASSALTGSASSVVKSFAPLSTVGVSITKETSINLVTASAVTNTGNEAAAKAVVTVLYRQLPIQ